MTIDLSNDGAILAIRTSINQPEYKGASVQVYKWNNTHYSPFFNRFPAGERGDIALSSDGMSLAVGRLFNGRQGGTTDVYKFQPSSRCGDDLELLRLSFTTDANPGETAWTLHIGSSETYESQSFNNMPFTTFVEEHCVAKDECIKFVVHDTAGDGMKAPGQFAIFLDGKEMIRGGQFDGVDVVKLGNCDCPSNTSLLSILVWTNYYNGMMWSVSHQNRLTAAPLSGNIMFGRPHLGSALTECIPNDCWSLSIYPPRPSEGYFSNGCHTWPCDGPCVVQPADINLDVYYAGDSIYSARDGGGFCLTTIDFGDCSSPETIICDSGSVPVRIEIKFNDEPWLTIWELVDQNSGEIINGGSDYLVSGVTLYEEFCKPTKACFNFILHNAAGVDEFKVFLGKAELVAEGSMVPIGDSCI